MKGRGGGKKPFGRKGFSPKGNSGKPSSGGKPFGKGREKSFESRASVSSHDVFDLGIERFILCVISFSCQKTTNIWKIRFVYKISINFIMNIQFIYFVLSGEEEQENLNELKKFADVETYDYELPEDFEVSTFYSTEIPPT